ncbi:hypothetical protein N9830_02020 [Akkermansiaceae bacterium]|nr:hypothetical protein [bacterium]MDB4259180.1 hypothetical protein [Akkermansiaceae bacterium]MDB4275997.1 hypothetical protein [Akkermansiaceae bacterium]MDB4287168.1 hypothetical protein [bacterium]MDB4301225.1 hypothetical protein [Akkermansiaceae bacterium]
MSGPTPLVCKASTWFIWRAILMLVMFGGFGVYFLYDWKVGYPKKNVVIANYEAFSAAGNAWAAERDNWEDFVAKQSIPFQEDRSLYPPDTDFDAKWPDILADKEGMDGGDDEGLWKIYSGEKGWPQVVDPTEDFKSKYKIDQQLYAAGVCLVLTAIALFLFLRTRGRSMKVDEEAYYAPDGAKISFAKMTQIDKRKWETKGLATISYTDEKGETAKAKVDGMVYGQFKEEDGAPAEKLFQHILANFEGELVELVIEDEDDEDSDSESSSESDGNEVEAESSDDEAEEEGSKEV